MTSALTWLLAVGWLSLQPDFCFTWDRRNADGYRYVELCGGRYQRPATWTCLEIPR